jgi:hypothetical protein
MMFLIGKCVDAQAHAHYVSRNCDAAPLQGLLCRAPKPGYEFTTTTTASDQCELTVKLEPSSETYLDTYFFLISKMQQPGPLLKT